MLPILSTSPAKPEFFDIGPADLGVMLGGPNRGLEPWRLVRAGKSPFEEGTLGPRAFKRLMDVCVPTPIEVVKRTVAGCGTRKILLRMSDGMEVETVIIPGPERSTVCVSSQVGCARGCRFCVTATMGAIRNLKSAEIVAQVHFARVEALAGDMPPLRNIVFMGMGEPLDNFLHVKKAIDVLVDPRAMGFAPRYVTLSTVGSSPHSIRRMQELSIRVAWSIHAVDNELRKQLVPTSKHSMEELRSAFLDVMHAQRDSLFVEITLIKDVNDHPEHAHALADFLEPFPPLVRINLLPVNAGREGMMPSSAATVKRFGDILKSRGYFSMTRTARGHEDAAACGQLAVANQKPSRKIASS